MKFKLGMTNLEVFNDGGLVFQAGISMSRAHTPPPPLFSVEVSLFT